MDLDFSVSGEDTFPVHRPVRMDVGHLQRPCYVYKASMPADPTTALKHGLDIEEGIDAFQRAMEQAFLRADGALTAAALRRDTDALFRIWSQTLETAYVSCLAPEHLGCAGGAPLPGTRASPHPLD